MLDQILESKKLHAENGCDWVEIDLNEFDWLIAEVKKIHSPNGVLVRIERPEGYEDVHPELVAEDALRTGWKYEVVV